MKHKNFFIVPNQIFELGLKAKEFVVYCCLLRHSDKNTDNCFPSRRLIADECSMDKKTVDSALKELEARGLIKKVCDLVPGMRSGVCPCDIPDCVAECFDGCVSYTSNMPRVITVSIGIFSVVRMERPGQYLVTGVEYAVPEKVCQPDCPENPCEMFRRMSFPVNEFYPPAATQPKITASQACGCAKGKP
jgi:hypothetical protein